MSMILKGGVVFLFCVVAIFGIGYKYGDYQYLREWLKGGDGIKYDKTPGIQFDGSPQLNQKNIGTSFAKAVASRVPTCTWNFNSWIISGKKKTDKCSFVAPAETAHYQQCSDVYRSSKKPKTNTLSSTMNEWCRNHKQNASSCETCRKCTEYDADACYNRMKKRWARRRVQVQAPRLGQMRWLFSRCPACSVQKKERTSWIYHLVINKNGMQEGGESWRKK